MLRTSISRIVPLVRYEAVRPLSKSHIFIDFCRGTGAPSGKSERKPVWGRTTLLKVGELRYGDTYRHFREEKSDETHHSQGNRIPQPIAPLADYADCAEAEIRAQKKDRAMTGHMDEIFKEYRDLLLSAKTDCIALMALGLDHPDRMELKVKLDDIERRLARMASALKK